MLNEEPAVLCEIRLLGGLTERAGANRIEVEVPAGTTVAGLRDAVGRQHPVLAPMLGRVKVAVDLEVAAEDDPVPPDAELALLPPVAGGAPPPDDAPPPEDAPPEAEEEPAPPPPRVRTHPDGRRSSTGLTTPPFDLDAATSAVVHSGVGGTVLFLGSVRDHAPDLAETVTHLEYSAYPEMAQRVLDEIADELLAELPALQGVVLHHAVGRLAVGEHTVLIVCAAAHRAEAFDACREALERVKSRVPVFKREITADGTHRWVGLDDCGHAAEAHGSDVHGTEGHGSEAHGSDAHGSGEQHQ